MRIITKLAIASSACLMLAGSAIAQQITLEANSTTPLRLSAAAASVVIGNPGIADVAVHNENLLFITGKSFGSTNLLIFDESGKQIYAGDISVITSRENLLAINRAGEVNTYDCAPRCQPTMTLGDDRNFFNDVNRQKQTLEQFARPDN